MPEDINQDTIMQGVANTLLMLALNHNAAVVELATKAITAGPMKASYNKRFMDEFIRLNKEYRKKFDQCIEQAEAQFNLGGK